MEEQRKKKKTEDQRAIYAIMNKPVVDLKLDTTKYPNDYVKGFIDVKLKEVTNQPFCFLDVCSVVIFGFAVVIDFQLVCLGNSRWRP